MVSIDPGIWIGALMTIGIFSLGFKYNKFYKFCEYTFVGLAVSYSFVLNWDNVNRIALAGIKSGKIYLLIPIIAGVMLYSRFTPKYKWVSAYPLAILVGVGTAVAIRGKIYADIIKGIAATAKPFFGPGDPITYINNMIFVVLFLSGLIFFIFTIPIQKGKPGRLIQKIGRFGLMLNFGALIGNTVATRYTFLIGRLQFLLYEWLGLAP